MKNNQKKTRDKTRKMHMHYNDEGTSVMAFDNRCGFCEREKEIAKMPWYKRIFASNDL